MGYEVASTNPPQPLRASGSQNIQADGRFWGHIIGVVPKQAARVRVEFREGIAPLELEPIRTDDRFPINFFAGFYPQPGEDLNSQWWATKVIAYDQAGRTIAECQTTGGPGPSC